MRKTALAAFIPVISILCLLVLGACPPAAEIEDVTQIIKVKNIPAAVAGQQPYKIFVQLANTMKASDGYVAKGELLLSKNPPASAVLADFKDEEGNDWQGSPYRYVNIVISPRIVNSIDDIDTRAGAVSSAKTLTLNWANVLFLSLKQAVGLGLVSQADYNLLYKNIIVDDVDIEGAKNEAK
jgi:hypothetical protein